MDHLKYRSDNDKGIVMIFIKFKGHQFKHWDIDVNSDYESEHLHILYVCVIIIWVSPIHCHKKDIIYYDPCTNLCYFENAVCNEWFVGADKGR